MENLLNFDTVRNSLPKLLIGSLSENLHSENLKFESINKSGRASAEVHWLFKPEEANGSAAAIIHYYAGGSAPPHLHNGFELIYILEGEMKTSTGIVKKNDLVLLKPGSIHESSSEIGCVALIIWQQPVTVINE
ncbi:cupin domain-containing protein [Xenorhabdus sp. PB61.4]|uniref:cupin domain-containing protein n=1 Tax=Xenorhabdus sp. PB61.4 TaxID=2788940 RepID=UPI001E284765|nr:cupin domain-containing protein [Xenorhabdus sp. PB61.4]MCC8365549.1 cupin domain-containing protein [Xenorhabdus sp. PB61.4]